MVLINVIFLIVLINELTGAAYGKVWSAVSVVLERKADYIGIYRWLRLGILFYILPGLALLFVPGARALAAGAGLSGYTLPGRIAVTVIFAAALVWMAGAAFSIIRYFREIRSFCEISEHNVEVGDERLREYFEEICIRRDIYKRVSVYMNTGIAAPVIFGVIRRQILLPTDCTGESELRMILEHEIVHVKHNDLLTERMAAIIGCMIWFLPQPMRMLAALEDWSETVCDISVCASDASVWKPNEYFSLVVQCAEEEEAQKPGMVMALGGGESSVIGTRIRRMRQYVASGFTGVEAVSQPREREADFQPDVRIFLLALGIALCAMFGIRQAGSAVAGHIATDDLVSHKMPWSGSAVSGSRVLARGVFTVRANSSAYRLLYLKENECIQVVYEASETHLSAAGDTNEEDFDSNVFGSVSVSSLFGAAQMNVPAALSGGTTGFAADRAGWYILKWDSDLADAGVMIDYVITEQ